MHEGLSAPFPWYGGKSRVAAEVWRRLGNPTVYAEPFFGSGAVLLNRPGGAGKREVVCDLDGGVANVWRALQADPEAVAHWCDWPSIHQDLQARHIWLRHWFADQANQEAVCFDPDFYDAKVAGWWLWGISLWIGGGWCAPLNTDDIRPRAGGSGVSAQRSALPTHDQRPYVDDSGAGQGVSAQVPSVADRPGGQGAAAQRSRRSALLDWFAALQERLASVVVFNRDWSSAVTPTVLMHTPSAPKPTVGVFLDPPYVTQDRSTTLYGSDIVGTSDDAAEASWQWAQEHGHLYRIAYCAHVGDIVIPDGWSAVTASFAGVRDAARRAARGDLIVFSPACEQPQPTLF